MTERLARIAARRPWATLGGWLLAVILAFAAIGGLLGDRLSTDASVTNNPESDQADRLIAERLPDYRSTTEVVVIRHERLTFDDAEFRTRLGELEAAGRRTGAIERIGDPRRIPGLVSQDRHAVLIPLRVRPPDDERVQEVIDAVLEQDGREGFAVDMTGSATTDRDVDEISSSDLTKGELRFGLPAALIVLVIVVGALVAAAIPLLLAVVAIVVGMGLIALLAQSFELSVFVVNMLIGMGLALGIDYALFVVARFREERAAGRSERDAIAATGATASRAVLFSGCAFVLAMLGLLMVQASIMRSLAVGAIVAGLVTVAGALTMLPAILGVLGDRVNRLHVPLVSRGVTGGAESRFWARIVRGVLRRPVVSLVAGVVVLLVAAVPVLGMNIGSAGTGTLPDRATSKQGLVALERSFPAASAEPAEIVVDGRATAPEVRAGVARLRRRLAADRDFGRGSVQPSPAGDAVLLVVPVAADPRSDRAVEAVRRLRAEHVPAAFAGAGTRVLVTGETAGEIDYVEVMERWLPIVVAFVLGLSFVLLTVAFRSVVVAVDRDRAQPALGGGGVRAAGAGLPAGHRRRPPRLPAGRHDRGVGAAVPVRRVVRAVDGLPGVPAQPDPRALHADRRHRRRDRARRELDRAHHHRGGAHHRGGVRRLRGRRSRDVPADGVRDRGGAADRRDARALGPRAGRDGPARRPQLVPPAVAGLAAPRRGRGAPPARGAGRFPRPRARTLRPVTRWNANAIRTVEDKLTSEERTLLRQRGRVLVTTREQGVSRKGPGGQSARWPSRAEQAERPRRARPAQLLAAVLRLTIPER